MFSENPRVVRAGQDRPPFHGLATAPSCVGVADGALTWIRDEVDPDALGNVSIAPVDVDIAPPAITTDLQIDGCAHHRRLFRRQRRLEPNARCRPKPSRLQARTSYKPAKFFRQAPVRTWMP